MQRTSHAPAPPGGISDIETSSLLPDDPPILAAGVAALVPIAQELRGDGHVDLSSLARPDASTLEGTMEASSAIWLEQTPAGTFGRLAKSLTFVAGAIAAQISRIDGNRLVDIARHKLRDIDLGDEHAYLIDDFPVTKHVLEAGVPRALSFLDEDLDSAEAFVLRELQMSCCLLLPLCLHGGPWGLVELYDMRLRRFTRDDQAVAALLVEQAARRVESFGKLDEKSPRLPLFQVQAEPDATGST